MRARALTRFPRPPWRGTSRSAPRGATRPASRARRSSCCVDRPADGVDGRDGVRVRPARRLGQHLVDDAQRLAVRRRQPHRFGGLLGAGLVLPENRRAALGRDDRVDRVLEHEDDVADSDPERSAGAALADDGRHDRGAKRRHLEEIPGDGLRDAPLLAFEAGEGARRVDEREDGLAELLGELHHPERLSVALGARHPEVAADLLPRVAALLVSDHGHRALPEKPEARDDRRDRPRRTRSPCHSTKSRMRMRT